MDSFTMKECKILDSNILDWAILEKGDNYRVFYQEDNLPWPLWHRYYLFTSSSLSASFQRKIHMYHPRTVVYVLILIEEDGAYYWVGTSTTHPDKPEEPAKFVR